MNVFEKLAKSAENRHGLELQPTQVQELVATLQAMQLQIANDQGRTEALSRILVVSLNQVGGALNIPSELFAEAERYVIDVTWDDNGEEIHASIRLADVGVPEVPEDGAAAPISDGSAVPVHSGDSGQSTDGAQDTDAEEE